MASISPSYRPSFNNCNEVNALCPVEASVYGDYFNLGGTIFYTVFYAILLIYTTVIGIWSRTRSFTIFLVAGIILELLGYGSRISMTSIGTVWNYTAFVIQLVCLILAPTFVAAAISVTFKWIVIYLGARHSVLKPKLYPIVFVGTDFFSIVIQAVGGAIAATATGGKTNGKLLDVGNALLVAGVAFQAANMTFCGGLMMIYWWRYRRAEKRGEEHKPRKASTSSETPDASGPRAAATKPSDRADSQDEVVVSPTRFRLFIYALLTAYIAVLVRCIYRIPEMALGWGSTLMQNETLFLILDGAMIAYSVLILSVLHPAFFFPILSRPKTASKGKSWRARLTRRDRTDVEK